MMQDDRHHDESTDDALRWQLRALRRDEAPSRDLWPQLSERIAQAPQVTPPAHAARQVSLAQKPWLPLALTASLLLVFGGFARHGIWLAPPAAPAGAIVQSEAQAMQRHYQSAFAALPPAGADSPYAPALRDLDSSATRILRALDSDPGARFLLQQLQRTYNQRLALTQRAALT